MGLLSGEDGAMHSWLPCTHDCHALMIGDNTDHTLPQGLHHLPRSLAHSLTHSLTHSLVISDGSHHILGLQVAVTDALPEPHRGLE